MWYGCCTTLARREGNEEGSGIVEAEDEEAINLRDIAVPTRLGLVEEEEILLLIDLRLLDLDINEAGLLM